MIHWVIDKLLGRFYKYLFLLLFIGAIFVLVVVSTCYRGKKGDDINVKDISDALQHKFKKKKKIMKRHETRCRELLERMLQKPFTSVRPDFLRYKTGKNLELDGYNEELQLAFEYQGIQHRKYCPGMFHASELDFIKQVQRDAFKKRRCEEEGIHVIYIPDTIKYDLLEPYLSEEIMKWSNRFKR